MVLTRSQPPISAAGFSSQAFAPHFPHTVRRTETKQCSDCHLSAANDNNAIMAQLLLQGTNFVNFVGMHSWIGLQGGFEAVRVTEWDEPQAVIGSYLQRYAYPDYYRMHVDRNHRELINWTRGETFDAALQEIRESTIFTTHTPVPAGHDAFPFHLVEKHLAGCWGTLGPNRDRFLALGSHDKQRCLPPGGSASGNHSLAANTDTFDHRRELCDVPSRLRRKRSSGCQMTFISSGTGVVGGEEPRRAIAIVQLAEVRCPGKNIVARIIGVVAQTITRAQFGPGFWHDLHQTHGAFG